MGLVFVDGLGIVNIAGDTLNEQERNVILGAMGGPATGRGIRSNQLFPQTETFANPSDRVKKVSHELQNIINEMTVEELSDLIENTDNTVTRAIGEQILNDKLHMMNESERKNFLERRRGTTYQKDPETGRSKIFETPISHQPTMQDTVPGPDHTTIETQQGEVVIPGHMLTPSLRKGLDERFGDHRSRIVGSGQAQVNPATGLEGFYDVGAPDGFGASATEMGGAAGQGGIGPGDFGASDDPGGLGGLGTGTSGVGAAGGTEGAEPIGDVINEALASVPAGTPVGAGPGGFTVTPHDIQSNPLSISGMIGDPASRGGSGIGDPSATIGGAGEGRGSGGGISGNIDTSATIPSVTRPSATSVSRVPDEASRARRSTPPTPSQEALAAARSARTGIVTGPQARSTRAAPSGSALQTSPLGAVLGAIRSAVSSLGIRSEEEEEQPPTPSRTPASTPSRAPIPSRARTQMQVPGVTRRPGHVVPSVPELPAPEDRTQAGPITVTPSTPVMGEDMDPNAGKMRSLKEVDPAAFAQMMQERNLRSRLGVVGPSAPPASREAVAKALEGLIPGVPESPVTPSDRTAAPSIGPPASILNAPLEETAPAPSIDPISGFGRQPTSPGTVPTTPDSLGFVPPGPTNVPPDVPMFTPEDVFEEVVSDRSREIPASGISPSSEPLASFATQTAIAGKLNITPEELGNILDINVGPNSRRAQQGLPELTNEQIAGFLNRNAAKNNAPGGITAEEVGRMIDESGVRGALPDDYLNRPRGIQPPESLPPMPRSKPTPPAPTTAPPASILEAPLEPESSLPEQDLPVSFTPEQPAAVTLSPQAVGTAITMAADNPVDFAQTVKDIDDVATLESIGQEIANTLNMVQQAPAESSQNITDEQLSNLANSLGAVNQQIETLNAAQGEIEI